MTLILELRDDKKEAVLKARAEAQGVSAEEYAVQILDRELQLEAGDATKRDVPFWKTFTDEVHAVPDDVFDRLPADGASEHDHYLYGSPKRNS